MNSDNYLFYSSGCNFSLLPPKPKIPVLTVKREMYPFRFNDSGSKSHCANTITFKSNEKISVETEIQFVRENDKSTVNTIRRRVVVDQKIALSDLPTQLLTEIGCIIDPSMAQVEVFGLRLLDWSCLIPLDVISDDLISSTVGDKLGVLLNYLLFFYRVSIKTCQELTSVEVWSIIYDLVKRYGPEGAYYRLKQMNCPLIKTNGTAFFDFLFQVGGINLDSLDQMFQLSFLDIFSFDNWYRSFPINQFLNGIKSMPTKFGQPSTNPRLNSATFEKLTNSLSEVLRQKSSLNLDVSQSSIGKSCDSIIQEALLKIKTESSFAQGEKISTIDTRFTEETFQSQKSETPTGFSVAQFSSSDVDQNHSLDTIKTEKRKVRNRVTFVAEDLKQLEEWFKDNPRPSRDKFQEFAAELNRRHQNFHSKAKRTLHARNIVYWFKNARAAYKRMSSLSSLTEEKCSSTKTDYDDVCSQSAENSVEHMQHFQNNDNDSDKRDTFQLEQPKQEELDESQGNVFLQQDSSNLTDKRDSDDSNSDNYSQEMIDSSHLSDYQNQTDIPSSSGNNMSNPKENVDSLEDSELQQDKSKSNVFHKCGKRRARIFLDPATEVNRLEQWFQSEKYPDMLQIESYTNILNMSPYRQNHFRKLVPENVTLWFKNRRARLKRCSNVSVDKTRNNR